MMPVATYNKKFRPKRQTKPSKTQSLALISAPPTEIFPIGMTSRTAELELAPPAPPRYSVLYPPDQAASLLPPLPPPRPAATVNQATHTDVAPPSRHALPRQISRLALNAEDPVSNVPNQQQHELRSLQHTQGALRDVISSKFCAVITSIDGEEFTGNEEDLTIRENENSGIRGGWGSTSREVSRGPNRAISSAVVGTNYFAKANLYANSKLPPNLPPLKL